MRLQLPRWLQERLAATLLSELREALSSAQNDVDSRQTELAEVILDRDDLSRRYTAKLREVRQLEEQVYSIERARDFAISDTGEATARAERLAVELAQVRQERARLEQERDSHKQVADTVNEERDRLAEELRVVKHPSPVIVVKHKRRGRR